VKRGKTIAVWAGAFAVAALVALGFAAKDRIRQEWLLWRIRRGDWPPPGVDEIVLLRAGRRVIPTPNPPPIDTWVKAIDATARLVVLSAGREQKVELHYEFTIYRDHEFIAKVKVIKLFPDLSGAEVLFVKEGAEIWPGDEAATKI
jgi:hypothetical protein